MGFIKNCDNDVEPAVQKTVFGMTVATMLGTASVAYALCVTPTDREAFHIRALQTDLMVAALTCDIRDHYNEFASKHKGALIEHGRALKKTFHAHHGVKVGERELNAYITALANRTSQRSISKRKNYCDHAGRTFDAVSQMAAHDLVTFSLNRPRSDVDVPGPCRLDTRLVERAQ